MRYDVFIGDMTLYGITSVIPSADRKVTERAGLESGAFATIEDAALRKWEIACELTETNQRGFEDWTPAKAVLKKIESMRQSKDPERLIIVSDNNNVSVRVLLESCSYTEKAAGAYDVSLRFVEYREVGVKSTDVPYIERPGKIPPAPVQVFSSQSAVLGDHQKRSGSVGEAPVIFEYQWLLEDGRGASTTNPLMVPLNTQVAIKERYANRGSALVEADPAVTWVNKALSDLDSYLKRSKLDDKTAQGLRER